VVRTATIEDPSGSFRRSQRSIHASGRFAGLLPIASAPKARARTARPAMRHLARSLLIVHRSTRMKSHTKHLTFHTRERMEFVNITSQVEAEVRTSGVREGLCLVNAMHITASVFINDDERGLHEDYKKWLEWLAPYDPSPQRYHHNRTGEDNGDAHHKRQVMGREVVVAITNGKLDFGPWEQIFYGEFDGRRDKRVMVKIIGE
jgi:secondary thiamine-phosphate synthase enzyme